MALNPLLKGLLQKTNQGFQAADDFLGTRGGNFALNLLAQQGFSTMPQSPLGAIGRAGLATAQQEQQAGMNDAQRRLIESTVGLNRARTQAALTPDPVETFRPPTQQEMEQFNLDPDVAYRVNTVTGQISQIGGGGTTINIPRNVGPIPPGMQLVEEGGVTRLEEIPGGPAERDRLEREAAEAARTEQETSQSNLVIQEIDRALGLADQGSILPEQGPLAPTAANLFPGSNIGRTAGVLQTIRSNIGFSQLQQMREASPTGGALGNVSERELSDLQAIAGQLEVSGNAEDRRFNLIRLRNKMLDVIHGVGNGPERMPLPSVPGIESESTVIDFNDLPPG